MKDSARGSTSIQLYASDTSKQPAEKTFIVFGTPRGGTSAIAGTMVGLGLNMGADLPNDNNYEDPDFAAKPREQIVRAIGERNSANAVWGWKFPNAANYLDFVRPHIRNPRFVVVFRDVVSTMKGLMRWHRRCPLEALSDVILHQQKNMLIILRWGVPTLLVSYEKAILNPSNLVRELAEFTGTTIPVDFRAFEQFLEPERYKSFSHQEAPDDRTVDPADASSIG